MRKGSSCRIGPRWRRLNVLVTTSYYWPEELGSAPYLAGLADYLQERGHHVVVATGYPHYPEWRLPSHAPVFRTERHAGVEVRRRWHYVPRRQTAAHRALYEASFFTLGLSALPRLPRPDVIVGTCPTLAAGGLAAVAAAIYRAPYALIFQDLMGQAARQSGVRGGTYVAAWVRRAECVLARRADGIGIVAEGFRTYLEQGGVPPENIRRLRNWTRRIEPIESVDEVRRRFGWRPGEFICLHGGNLGLKQGLDNLLEAAALLRGEGVRIVFSGDGNDRARLEQRARQLDLHDVQFIGLLREPGLYEAVARASDVLLVNQRPSVTDMSLPSKLTSYFAAARPVIAAASPDSETAREVEAARAGFVVAPDDPTALSSAIMELRRNPEAAASMAGRAKQYADEYLSPHRVLSEYEEFLEEIATIREAGRRARPRRAFGVGRRRSVEPVRDSRPLRSVEAPDGSLAAELREIRTAFPRVAIVHDWLTVPGGSEQVLAALLDLFPDAEVFTSVYDPQRFPPIIRERTVHASVLGRLPRASRWYPRMLPLMRGAFRRFDLRSFDLILSSSHAFAKSARAEGRPHVCYCHTPLRLLWEPRFLAGEPVGPVGRASAHLLRPHLRRVDRKDADTLDAIMANSTYTAERILRYWGRDATVVHPPVAVERFLGVEPKPGASYVVLGRIVPYKRVDLAVAACARLGRAVTVIGEGRALEQATSVAGAGARFLGRIDDDEVRKILSEARAVICCADEDFGIVPVEAQAAGVPVIAYGVGGHRDSVEDGRNGVLFYEQSVDAVVEAIERFERMEFDPHVLRENAQRFSTQRFHHEVVDVLADLIRGEEQAPVAVAEAL